MNKTTLFFVLFGIAVVGLVMYMRNEASPSGVSAFWPGTEVACLPFGHANLAQHIHPKLFVFVDGAEEEVPANIGTTEDCMAELHTHDATGEIHIETVAPNRTFTVSDFFAVWGRPIDREGFDRTITVNGAPAPVESYIFNDADEVVVNYTSK